MNHWIFSSCAISLFVGGCAHPTQARAPEPPHKPAAAGEAPTLGLAYELTRQGDGTGVVMAGRSEAGPYNVLEVQQHAAKTGEKEELRLKLRPRDDGSVLVEVRYAEVSADGGHIAWEPLVHVARGTPAVAEIQGAGWSRAIRVRIE